MRIKLQQIALALVLLAGSPGVGHAEAAERPAPSGGILSLLPPPQISDHSIVVWGRTLDYQAKAGTLSLLSGKGDVTAEVFYVAYTLQPGSSRRTGSRSGRSPLYSTGVRERLPPICISARSARASWRRRPMEVFCRRRSDSWTIRTPGST